MIVYFSGTGNSRFCAEFLAKRLGDEVLDVFSFLQDGIAADLTSRKPWVFVSPTYGWRIPRIFEEFILSARFQGSKNAYFVMTCGSEIGRPMKWLEALCGEKDLTYLGVLEVVMPENYVAMFPVPEMEEAVGIVRAALPTLESAVPYIAEELPLKPHKAGVLDSLKSGPMNRIFYRFFVKADAFFSTDVCISCGKCMELCVQNNIRLIEGKPNWGDCCTHCMACICGCPTEAIEYGKKSRGKPRYHCPILSDDK